MQLASEKRWGLPRWHWICSGSFERCRTKLGKASKYLRGFIDSTRKQRWPQQTSKFCAVLHERCDQVDESIIIRKGYPILPRSRIFGHRSLNHWWYYINLPSTRVRGSKHLSVENLFRDAPSPCGSRESLSNTATSMRSLSYRQSLGCIAIRNWQGPGTLKQYQGQRLRGVENEEVWRKGSIHKIQEMR